MSIAQKNLEMFFFVHTGCSFDAHALKTTKQDKGFFSGYFSRLVFDKFVRAF